MKHGCVILSLIIIALAVLPAASLHAEGKPVQLALVAPVQLFPQETPITGLRLSLIYGRNTSITGVDLGLVNHTTSGMSKGYQWGLVGLADADFMGWQNNFVNTTKGNFEGFQWGFVNYANHASGFQLGFVNYAVSMRGLQIGLVNIIKQGGQFPVFPIINWSF